MIVKLIHRPESAFRFYLDGTLDRFEYHLQNGDFPDDDEREEERLELYELLTDQQRQQVWGLSADLYSLLDNEQSPSDHQKLSPKQIAEKLQSSYQMSDWTEVLSLLRLQTGTIRRSVIDCMRYRAWSELGFPNIALAFIKNAIRLDPTDFGYKHLALELLKKMKDWESLAEHSQKYVAQCPDDGVALLEGWIQEWPTHPEFYGARGMIRLTMDYDLAIVDFKEAVELGTQSVLPYIEYANWLLHEGRHSEAIVVAENGLDFNLPRAASMALREYVPGNLIYANGHRFVARRFHREADMDEVDTPVFAVNVDREAIIESDRSTASGSLSEIELMAIPVCDVDLVHMSQISDEEENRFQLSVATYGREQGRHNGGQAYGWGGSPLHFRRGVHYRMVNVGASSLVDRTPPEMGYPVCRICGQSVSPLSSVRQIQNFRDKHTEWCGQEPVNVGFYADVVADSLTMVNVSDQTTAYTILESIRQAAVSVLDMHLDDLQLLVVGHVDRDEVDGSLWDPMAGGSGLLTQLLENLPRIISTAAEMLAGCPSNCGSSCNDCLQTFRNAYYHRYLDRHAGLEFFERAGNQLSQEHLIPTLQPSPENNPASPAGEVNDAEAKLKHLLSIAGFASGSFQQQIRFKYEFRPSPNLSSTTPDVYFDPDPDDPDEMGICVYLDGMSDHIHGNAKTAAKDTEIRSWLRSKGYSVIKITRLDLDDSGAMRRHLKKQGRLLVGKEFAKSLDENDALVAALSQSGTGGHRAEASEQQKTPDAVEPESNDSANKPKRSAEYEEVLDLVGGDVRQLVLRLADEGVPAPEPGLPLDDEDGVTIAESELAWPEKSVAYFRKGEDDSAEQFRARSWVVIMQGDLQKDLAAIQEALS